MRRIEQNIAGIERKLKHVDAPNPLIIYPHEPGEPERSIKRFESQYPDDDGVLIILPENEHRYAEEKKSPP